MARPGREGRVWHPARFPRRTGPGSGCRARQHHAHEAGAERRGDDGGVAALWVASAICSETLRASVLKASGGSATSGRPPSLTDLVFQEDILPLARKLHQGQGAVTAPQLRYQLKTEALADMFADQFGPGARCPGPRRWPPGSGAGCVSRPVRTAAGAAPRAACRAAPCRAQVRRAGGGFPRPLAVRQRYEGVQLALQGLERQQPVEILFQNLQKMGGQNLGRRDDGQSAIQRRLLARVGVDPAGGGAVDRFFHVVTGRHEVGRYRPSAQEAARAGAPRRHVRPQKPDRIGARGQIGAVGQAHFR
jgi:hypothetical protein